jgi:hypothetical protein
MGAMYVAIMGKTAYELPFKSSVSPGVSSAQRNTLLLVKRRFRISKVLFLSFLWFCASMYPLPIAIAYFAKEFSRNIQVHLTVRYLISYSCFNPVSSLTCSDTFGS